MSFVLRRIARTPEDARPMGRTSRSLNRMESPRRVAMIISSPGLARCTQPKRSPVCSFMAIMPDLRTSVNCRASVFLMTPCSVIMVRNNSPSLFFFGTGRMDVTRSEAASARKFAIALPLETRLPSGSSNARIWYALPRDVKKRSSS